MFPLANLVRLKTLLVILCVSALCAGATPETPLVNLEVLTKEMVRGFSPASKELEYIYGQLFQRWLEDWDNWKVIALEDIAERKNEAVPILVRVFLENSAGHEFRSHLLENIDSINGISLHPFVEAIREVWKKEGLNLDSDSAVEIVWFLASYGEEEDKKIMEGMLDHRDKGRVGSTAKDQLLYMIKRLDGTMKPSEWHGHRSRTPDGYRWNEKASANKNQPSVLPVDQSNHKASSPAPLMPSSKPPPSGSAAPQEPTSRSWTAWLFVVIAATAGAAWLLLRKRK